jgi:hypothetical protein
LRAFSFNNEGGGASFDAAKEEEAAILTEVEEKDPLFHRVVSLVCDETGFLVQGRGGVLTSISLTES